MAIMHGVSITNCFYNKCAVIRTATQEKFAQMYCNNLQFQEFFLLIFHALLLQRFRVEYHHQPTIRRLQINLLKSSLSTASESFSRGLFNSQEKLKTMLMPNVGLTNKEYYGLL